MKLAKPALLRRAEERLRPLDRLTRPVAVGVGLAAGVGAGALAGWTGEPWALGVAAGTLATAGWLASSGDARSVAVPRKPLVSAPLGMIPVPGGTYWMGSADDDALSFPNERPRHQETVAPFEVACYVVRQSLYQAVMGANPSPRRGPDLPVYQVSWFDAIHFCNVLSVKDDFRRAYRITGDAEAPIVEWDPSADGFRLPTEAEWEYVARAGTDTPWSFGDDERQLGDHAWWAGNSRYRPHPVGTKRPNPWGLFDVHGNVWEWCWDVSGPNGQAPGLGGDRVIRGGSSDDPDPRDLRSAARLWSEPERAIDIGFRCVRGGSRQP